MLLINIHHYIMGLAGSARTGGEAPGRRRWRRHAVGESGGGSPGPARGSQPKGRERIPKWGPEGRSRVAQRNRGRREEVWARGGSEWMPGDRCLRDLGGIEGASRDGP